MSIEAAKQRLIEAKKQVDVALIELEQAEKADSDPRWKPHVGMEYFSIDNTGGVFDSCVTDDCDECTDNKRIDFGNAFQTREQAEKHAKRLRVFNLSWALAGAMNGGQIPKHGFYTISDGGTLIGSQSFSISNNPAFYNEIDRLKSVEIIGGDVIKDAWSND